jgi:hypothetical protein
MAISTDRLISELNLLGDLQEKDFKAGDKVLALLEGVRQTLENTRESTRVTIAERDAKIAEQLSAITDRDRELVEAARLRAEREAEHNRTLEALDSTARDLRTTSEALELIKSQYDLTVEQLAAVEAAKAQAEAAYIETMRAKDEVIAQQVADKLALADQVTKLGNDISNLTGQIDEVRRSRDEIVAQHEADNERVLAKISQLFTAQQIEDADIRAAGAQDDPDAAIKAANEARAKAGYGDGLG